MPEILTDSIQDYLKAIYSLTGDGEPASTSSLADELAVEPASVTGMLQRLAATQHPLVEYRKHHGVKLTAAGRRAALEVIRHHRLLETWLVQSLGYSWTEVHREAEKLEHAISEEMEQRIAAALGNPTRDPHGEPIPNAALVMPRDPSVPLASLRAGQKAEVCRVEAHDPALLDRLEQLRLVPGTAIRVLDVSSVDHIMHLRIGADGKSAALGPAITNRVYVEVP